MTAQGWLLLVPGVVWLAAGAAPAQRAPVFEPPGVYAPGHPSTMRCPRASGEIRIDGALEDAGWRGVGMTETFLNWNAKGVPPYPTVARLAWDYRTLYVAILSKDADISSPYRRRDDPLARADVAGVLIGLEGFPNRYVHLAVSPANVLFDARIFDPGDAGVPEIDRAWNMRKLQTAVRVDGTLNQRGDRDRGWTLEMSLPLTELGLRRPPEPGDVWRVNLYRIDRGAESSFGVWSPLLGAAPNLYQPEQFGFLEFAS